MSRFSLAILLSAALFMASRPVSAEVRHSSLGDASQEELAEAAGHYARARALLIAAVNEFDRGRKVAKPDDLIEPAKWRSSLLDRAEDLERLLDPQPRVTKGGVRFEADPRLLPEAKK